MKKLYMIQMNLSGLHNRIYTMSPDKETAYWYDSAGDVSFREYGKKMNEFGLTQIVFNSRKEAVAALKGATMVKDFLKLFLTNEDPNEV